MSCCVATGCTVRRGPGKILHNFPKNPVRRRLWEIKVGGENWSAGNGSHICTDHFEENQYESGRADDLKRLKPDAVPTKLLFQASNAKEQTPPPKRSLSRERTIDVAAKRLYCQNESEHISEKAFADIKGANTVLTSMVTPEPHLRIPGVLVSSYQKLISTEEGKSAMKRIRVECGVCKATRFYSIHRGITRIAGVVACEACRQFYQRFKKQPWVVECNKGGKCYELDETPKNKCKACWVAHIICRCPVPVSLYNNLIGYLPTELKAKMAARPPTSDEVPEEKRGGLGLEVYKDDGWLDVTDRSELASLVHSDDAIDSDEVNEPEMDVEYEAEEEAIDDPGVPDSENEKGSTSGALREGLTRRGKKTRSQSDDPDERQTSGSDKGSGPVMTSLIEGLHINNQNKFMENFNPKTSERVKRKKKKVQYFNSSGRTKANGPQCIYAQDGTLACSGKDLCDCLQGDCPGCHYPCPKCSSKKCGSECRQNRKWYYEKVEVEGTKLNWTNVWIKKPEKG
ncbi:uncharacterized protein [Palaemon carinicauda]|uniref:uncharacterized protein isoform X2 n=1 Tax=Palaemon carinicauda TaxID=392227 RepID=UPI0035B635A3